MQMAKDRVTAASPSSEVAPAFLPALSSRSARLSRSTSPFRRFRAGPPANHTCLAAARSAMTWASPFAGVVCGPHR